MTETHPRVSIVITKKGIIIGVYEHPSMAQHRADSFPGCTVMEMEVNQEEYYSPQTRVDG